MIGNTLRSDQRGQTGIALVIIIAWALTAVFMLTRTLISAQQIDGKVSDIVGTTTPIKTDTAFVAELTETNRLAKDILSAAAPISPALGEVDASAKSINATVPQILSSAQSINSTVKSINGGVSGILSTVRDIAGGAATLGGVRAINERLDKALTIINPIKSDTGTIRAEVADGSHGKGIHYHACTLGKLLLISGDDHC